MKSTYQNARRVFEQHGGILRTTEALKLGVSPRTLYEMRDANELRTLSRGVYQLASRDVPSHPELVIVGHRLSKAVVCLISALYFHQLTTQVPHYTYVALPMGSPQPKLDFPPLHIIRLSGRRMTSGIETHNISGEVIHIYSVAKTVADCFRFRNKIGIDVAIEALREALQSRKATVSQISEFARINRVTNVMRPYLEALA